MPEANIYIVSPALQELVEALDEARSVLNMIRFNANLDAGLTQNAKWAVEKIEKALRMGQPEKQE